MLTQKKVVKCFSATDQTQYATWFKKEKLATVPTDDTVAIISHVVHIPCSCLPHNSYISS